MKSSLQALLILIILLLDAAFAQRAQVALRQQSAEKPILKENKNLVILRALDQNMFSRIGPPAQFFYGGTETATFEVTYIGFSPQAQAAFQYAVDIWANLLSSPMPIKIIAHWKPLDPGVLGSAGPATFALDQNSGTWFPIALAEKLAGNNVNHPDSADIIANFSSSFSNWYLGTDGNTPSGQYDFVSVVLHELCHGLGFTGSMTVSQGQGSWGFGTGYPIIYDRFTENGAGQKLMNTAIFPNPSPALSAQLTSGDIYFNGPEALAANGGMRPKLYAPPVWEPGSSYAHLDEDTYPAGNPNSLMTPGIGMAESIHNPGNITLGIYQDMGWTVSGITPGYVKWEETFNSTTPPANWFVIDNDGSALYMDYYQMITFTSGDTVMPHAGQSFWFSNFYNANFFTGLLDEWLISPQIPGIEDGDSLYFCAGAIDDGYDDSLRVFISTTNNQLNSFVYQIAYFKVDGPVGSWHWYGFDLSPFAGSDIYIAVNYYIVDGGLTGNNSDNVWIDHFLITSRSPAIAIEDDANDPYAGIPAHFALQQNYPNPFNPLTHIPFELPRKTRVKIDICNSLGQRVGTVLDAELSAGYHDIEFDAGQLPSGIYFYRLQGGGRVEMKKMILLK